MGSDHEVRIRALEAELVVADAIFDEIRALVQAWVDRQGHERCWYYPDLFEGLAGALGVVPRAGPGLPPRGEFERGCLRYQEEQYGPRPPGDRPDGP